MFHCLVIKVLCFACRLADDLITLSYRRLLVNIFFVFSKLFELFDLFIQKKQFSATAQLEYHYKVDMSTPFLTFLFFLFLQSFLL